MSKKYDSIICTKYISLDKKLQLRGHRLFAHLIWVYNIIFLSTDKKLILNTLTVILLMTFSILSKSVFYNL